MKLFYREALVAVVAIILAANGCGGKHTARTYHSDFNDVSVFLKGKVLISVQGFAGDSLPFVNLPQLRDSGKFIYPEIARKAGVTGTPRFIVSVDKNGNILNSQMTHSCWNWTLDEAAQKDISSLKFVPPVLRTNTLPGHFPPCVLEVGLSFQLYYETHGPPKTFPSR